MKFIKYMDLTRKIKMKKIKNMLSKRIIFNKNINENINKNVNKNIFTIL